MKLQIMILAVVLVTVLGPAAGEVYQPCQLATVLPQCGLDFSVNDCKYTAPAPSPPFRSISIKINRN